MPIVAGDRVRLVKPSPVRNVPGPPLGAIGTVIACEVHSAPNDSSIWRVAFDGLADQFYAASPPGIWFVHPDEIEILIRK